VTGRGPSADRPAAIARRLDQVRERIATAGGDVESIGILAVTKGFGPDAVTAALAAGLVDLGENYAQELVVKADAAAAEPTTGVAPARWHMIGRLQRNKVRALAPLVHLWQSVDREPLGAEIAARAPGARVLVQVNLSGEVQKGGCAPEGTARLVDALAGMGLDVHGLMAVGPTGEPEAARPGFALLRRMADDLALPVRSMGMSADLEVAVQEGSNLVRVGTALFGPRTTPRPDAR